MSYRKNENLCVHQSVLPSVHPACLLSSLVLGNWNQAILVPAEFIICPALVPFSMIIFGVIKREPGQNWIQAFPFIFSHLKACAFMWKKVYRNSPAGRCCKLPQIVSSLLQISKIQKKVHFSSIWYWNVLHGCISYLFTKVHDAAVKKSPAATWSKIRCGPKFQHFPPKNESFVSKKKYST